MPRYRTDILVVDDDRLIRTLLTELMMKKPGRHVKAVASGAEALAYLDVVRPDLIVLDVLIPDIDGITLFRRIHHRPVLAAVPVLFVSSLSRVQGGKLEGKFQWLDKSFIFDELEPTVAELLGESGNVGMTAQPDRRRWVDRRRPAMLW